MNLAICIAILFLLVVPCRISGTSSEPLCSTEGNLEAPRMLDRNSAIIQPLPLFSSFPAPNDHDTGFFFMIVVTAAILLPWLASSSRNFVPLIIMTFALCSNCAGYVQFERKFGPVNAYTGYAIAAIPNQGGYYVASKRYDTLMRVLVIKLDISGEPLYIFETCSIGDPGLDIKYTADGGCIFVSSALSTSCTEGSPNMIVVKLSSVLGVQHFRTIATQTYGSGVVQLSTGGYAVVGFLNGYVSVLHPNLDTYWYSDRGPDNFYDVIELEGEGQIAVVGQTVVSSMNSGRYELWSLGGALINGPWFQQGSGGSYYHSLVRLTSTTVAVVGITNNGNDQPWFVVLSLNGGSCSTYLSLSEVGPGQGIRIRKTNDGLVLGGYTSAFGFGSQDMWVRFIDANGNTQTEWTFGGADSDRGYGLDVTDDGAVAVAGTYSNGGQYLYVVVKARATATCAPGKGVVPPSVTCQDCAAGTFKNTNALVACSECGLGQYQPSTGQSSCIYCAAGTYQDGVGKTSCIECGVGTFQAYVGQSFCYLCPAGTYQDQPGKTSCVSCPPGSSQPQTHQSVCVPCVAGTYQSSACATSCAFCLQGFYQPQTGQTSCLPCSPGSYQSNPGQTTCNLCGGGTYQGSASATSCAYCSEGYYQPQTGQTSCLPCLPGSYQSNPGQAACNLCGGGTYQDSQGAASCVGCPAGKFQDAPGMVYCAECGAGSAQPNQGQSTCVPCAAGKYQSGTGQASCLDCPSGSYQSSQGQSACVSCGVGTYQSGAGNTACSDCPAGSYQNSPGMGTCISCWAGSYQPSVGQSTCLLCGLGTYQSQPGKTYCDACSGGSYQDSQGMSTCISCLAGSYQPNIGQTACVLCGLGTYQSQPGKTYCDPCSGGSYQNQPGQTSCLLCSKGTYQPGTVQSSCLPCEVATYQDQPGSISCKDCPVGSYQNLPGKEACDPCEPGTYQNLEHQTVCLPCGLMQYQDQNGQSACKSCPATTYQDQLGQSSCKSCLANCSVCVSGTDCSACISNHFLHILGPVTTCENPCPDEYYGYTGDYTCKSCLEHCKECTDNVRCGLCLPGFYRYRTAGKDECLAACPTRMYGNDTTRTCEDCISRCQNCTTSTNCYNCDATYYVDTLSEGINECVNPCRDGYFHNPDDKCQSCLSGCRTCKNATRCFDCFSPLALKYLKAYDNDSCVSDCGARYYANPNRVCATCDFRCLSCTDSTPNSCPDCNLNLEGVAKTSAYSCGCADGYTPSLPQEKCLTCSDPLCLSCNPEKLSQCLACSTSIPGIVLNPATYSCVCASGKYRDGDTCPGCNVLCSECTGGTNKDCLPGKCSAAYKAYPLEGVTTTCLYMCKTIEDNLFVNWTTKMCQACKPPCKSCFNSTVTGCSSCVPKYLLLGSVCADKCPAKYYEDIGVCLPCDAKCKSCAGKTNYCVDGCESPYLFKNHRCLSECGEGYTGVEGICEECDSNCAICYYDTPTTKKICTQCVPAKFLYQGTCLQLCPSGYYPDSAAGECKPCAVECTKCLAAGNKACTTCNTTFGYTMIAPNVCDYPTCTRGTYFNITLRSCLDCRSICSECSGYDYCSSCTKGYLLNPKTHTCYDECSKVGFKRLPVTLDCVEICGDGRNMGELACDDGNVKDGDGCNSACQVEANYECIGGNETNADSCVNRKQPEFAGLKYYGNRTGVVSFTAPVKFTGTMESLVSVQLEGGEENCVGWTYVAPKRKYNRQVTFYLAFNCSLTGDEELVMKVNNVSRVEDANGNVLKYDSVRTRVFRYKYVAAEFLAGTEAVGSVSFYAMILSVGTSLGISLIFNTPIEGMWAAMSVLQMMSYITLMNLNFPENLLAFLGYMESVHNFNKWLPNAFTYIFKSQYLDLSPYNDQFNARGFSSRNMLYLCGSDLVMMAAMGLAILIFIPLSNVLSICDTVLKKLRYNSLIRSFIQSYLKICLASFINVGVYAFDNPTSAVSSLIAIITGCLLIGTPAFISEFLYQNHELASSDKSFRTTHASYISGFRVKANVLNLMFYPIFLFRRLAFAATITLLSNYPSLQLALILAQTAAIIFYMYHWKPYRSKYSFYSSLAAETMFAGCTIVLFAFVDPRPEATSCRVGWVVISLVITSLLASWICVGAQQIRIYQKRQGAKARKEAELKQVKTRKGTKNAEAGKKRMVKPRNAKKQKGETADFQRGAEPRSRSTKRPNRRTGMRKGTEKPAGGESELQDVELGRTGAECDKKSSATPRFVLG